MQMSPKSPFHLTFVLFEGFSNMVLAIASSSRAVIGADLPLSRVGATDALVLVAGYGVRNHLDHDSAAAVRRKARGLPVVGGHDTGAWLLARLGLLGGRKATIHWMEKKEFAENFPEVRVTDGP